MTNTDKVELYSFIVGTKMSIRPRHIKEHSKHYNSKKYKVMQIARQRLASQYDNNEKGKCEAEKNKYSRRSRLVGILNYSTKYEMSNSSVFRMASIRVTFCQGFVFVALACYTRSVKYLLRHQSMANTFQTLGNYLNHDSVVYFRNPSHQP